MRSSVTDERTVVVYCAVCTRRIEIDIENTRREVDQAKPSDQVLRLVDKIFCENCR